MLASYLMAALLEATKLNAARMIARVTGCELGAARVQMNQLPGTLPIGLFRPQAVDTVPECQILWQYS